VAKTDAQREIGRQDEIPLDKVSCAYEQTQRIAIGGKKANSARSPAKVKQQINDPSIRRHKVRSP
jgi:hypothetical protein